MFTLAKKHPLQRLQILLLLFLSSHRLYGQNHIEFRGIELNGPISSFVSQLEKIGYTKNGGILSGNFSSEKCNIEVFCTPTTETVYAVQVDFQRSISSENYSSFMKAFTEKYGQPSFKRSDRSDCFSLVEKEILVEGYELKTGIIYMYKSPNPIHPIVEVRILYVDSINSELNSKEKDEIARNNL